MDFYKRNLKGCIIIQNNVVDVYILSCVEIFVIFYFERIMDRKLWLMDLKC